MEIVKIDPEMVKKVLITKTLDGWKQIEDGFVDSGVYIIDNRKFTDIMNIMLPRQWGMIDNKRTRLIDAVPWIVRYYLSNWQYGEKLTKSTTPVNIRPDLFKWQKDFCELGNKTLTSGYKFKVGLFAEPGSGKTIPALSFCESFPDSCLYIAPEQAFVGAKEMAISWGLPIPTFSTPGKLHKLNKEYDIVIIDEALIGKNPLAQRSKAITKITAAAQIVIAMTGTPTSGAEASDLRWLNLLGFGNVIPDKQQSIQALFGKNPVIVKQSVQGKEWTEINHSGWDYDLIDKFIAPYVYVADTTEIKDTVKNVTYERIVLPTPLQYGMLRKGLGTKRTHSKMIAQLRTITSGFITQDDNTDLWLETIPKKIETVKTLLKSKPEPTILVSAHCSEQEKLVKEFEDYGPAVILAGTSSIEREVQRFQNGETDLLILSFGKASSMNLQRASQLIFLSNGSKPTDRIQAIRRIYRIGQINQPKVIDIVCENTLDIKVIELLEKHMEVTDELLTIE